MFQCDPCIHCRHLVTSVDSRTMTAFAVVSVMLIFSGQVLESSPAVGIVGREVNINITISDSSIDTHRGLIDPNNVTLLYFNPKAANAAYIDPNVTYTGNIPGGFVSFTLSKLTIQSAGIYQYIIWKGTANVTAGEQNLVIAGSPNTPVITALSQQALAGREYKLNCSAVSTSEKPGHNLTMFSEWKRNGTYITSNDSKYGVNETILTFRNLSKTDSNVYLTCIAFEDERVKSLESTAFPLNVYYGPDKITLYPSQTSYDLVENSPFNANCSADCVPSCKYRWTSPGGNYTDGTGILSISKISRSQTGVYTCTASNPNITGNAATANVSVMVHYGPENITLSPSQMSYDLVEYSSLNVNCSANCVPSCQYRWTGPGLNLTDKTEILSISNISRSQTGVFSCTASNPKISNSDTATTSVNVTVQYPPSIQGLTSPYKVIENQSLNVTCVVNSNPPANLIGWSPKGEGAVNSILYFSSVSRNNSGNYSCTAQNTMTPTDGEQQNGSTTSQIQVDVQYGARISNLSVHGGNTINENSSAIFNCHVDSNPPSTITWMKEGSSAVLKTESGVVQSNYTIKSAECLENYTCSADNGIWTTAKERLELFVKCHPRTDFRLGLETKLYRKRHGEAILRYTVISYPPPSFTWIFLGNGSESRALPVSASQHDNGQQSELRITNLGITDFGNYSVIANNSVFPSAMVVFEIIPADVPEVPSNVTIIEITQTSVKVQWLAGYNGGQQQTFHIVASAGSSTHNVTADDPGYQQTATAVLNGLLPGTKYSIHVVAINLIGPSNITPVISVTTLKDTDISNPPLAAVAGGIGAGVGVILVVALVLFLVRRYRHQKPCTDGIEENKTERTRPESGLVDNPVYDTSEPLPGPSATAGITEAEYAKVNKPKKKTSNMNEANNIYSQVNKTKKNFKKDADKGKHGKMSRGDIYENAADLVVNRKAEPCDESLYEDAGATGSNGPMINKDGLHYADLMLGPPSRKDGKDIIQGLENRTEYAEIAYGKRGEPLPDSDN